MPRQLPIGSSDFKEMRRIDRRDRTYYVDKTPLIHAILQEEITSLLITRPIRFMKSTNLSMLRYFFDITHAEENDVLFDALAIKTAPEYQATWEQHHGKYPVIYLSLKDVKGRNWDTLYVQLAEQIQKAYAQHSVLENSAKLSNTDREYYTAIKNKIGFTIADIIHPLSQQAKSNVYVLYCNALSTLIKMLYEHYHQKVVILIDEYDAPLHSAYQHTAPQYKDLTTLEISALPEQEQEQCCFHKTREWIAQFLESALKDNDARVFKAVMTGVLRTAFASLISSLNNVSVHSVLSHKFANYFGITETELAVLCEDIGLTADPNFSLNTLKEWYNGYQVGHAILYNPWSVANYLTTYQDASQLPISKSFIQPRAYWLQVGDSSVIGDYGRKLFSQIESSLVQLIQKNEIVVDIDERTVFSDLERHDVSAFWGLLLHTGYLTVKRINFLQEFGFSCFVAIPNQEVSGAYMVFITRWFREASLARNIDFKKMLNNLLHGEIDYFRDNLEHYILSVVSYFDIARKTKIIRKSAKTLKRKRDNEEQDKGKEEEQLNEDVENITPEQMYHLLVLGFVAGLHGYCYQVQSNRESGHGRYDVILSPRDPEHYGIIFEFKAAQKPEQLENRAQEAITQIRTRRYQTALESHGVKRGLHIGIAFCGKRLHLISEKCDYRPTAAFHLPASPFSPPTTSTPPLIIPGDFHSPFAGDEAEEQRIIVPGTLSEATVQFEIHPTSGKNDNCGFYAIPIAGDRAGVRRLLLGNAGNADIRQLVAPEIQDIVISGHIPANTPDYQFYASWRALYTTLQIMTVDQEQMGQHLAMLKNYILTQKAFENFVNFDVGGRGRLAYYTDQQNTSTIDAIARLANLRIFIYQRNTVTNTLQLVTIRGNADSTPTYLHHHAGTDTHFELMSIVESEPNTHLGLSNTSSSTTSFFASPPSSSSDQEIFLTEHQPTQNSSSLEL